MDQMKVIENTSSDSNEKSDKNSTNLVDNNVSSLCPITPYKESANSTTFTSSPLKEDDQCPSTPVEDVFDSFTSGLNRFKHVEKPESHVARRLKFNSDDKELVSETKYETVYESVLEAIINKEAEDVIAEIMENDVFKTPPGPRLSGIAETCPGAPLKRIKRSRNVDVRFCRKLEF